MRSKHACGRASRRLKCDARLLRGSVLLQFFCENNFLYMTHLANYLPRDRPATIVDAGANIGLASLMHAVAMNFYGQVLSVEANPMTLRVRMLPSFTMVLTTATWRCDQRRVRACGGGICAACSLCGRVGVHAL
jgi:hypothetical protein